MSGDTRQSSSDDVFDALAIPISDGRPDRPVDVAPETATRRSPDGTLVAAAAAAADGGGMSRREEKVNDRVVDVPDIAVAAVAIAVVVAVVVAASANCVSD